MQQKYSKGIIYNFFYILYKLNNRNLFLCIGLLTGLFLGFYGIKVQSFTTVPVLGAARGHSLIFKIIVIILSGGGVGALFSYVGNAIDIFTNGKTILHIFDKK